MKTRYEVYSTAERRGEQVEKVWRWRAVATENGKILAMGESYSRKVDALSTATRLAHNDDEIVVLPDLHQDAPVRKEKP